MLEWDLYQFFCNFIRKRTFVFAWRRCFPYSKISFYPIYALCIIRILKVKNKNRRRNQQTMRVFSEYSACHDQQKNKENRPCNFFFARFNYLSYLCLNQVYKPIQVKTFDIFLNISALRIRNKELCTDLITSRNS